jgi:hypothetical protein
MTAVAPSRFQGISIMLACLALAVAICAFLSQWLAPALARSMADGDSTMEGGQEAIVGGRIAGVLVRTRRGPERTPDLGVLLGASAVGMDIDPATLEAAGGPGVPARWLSLYANGANVSDLRGLAELLFMNGPPIKLLVLGLHPALLARSDTYLTDPTVADTRDFWRAYEAGHLMSAREELAALMLAPMNRFFPERTRIGHQSRVLAAKVKRRLFAALGLGADSLYAPDLDPWTVRLLIEDERAEGRAAEAGRRVAVRELQEGPMREGLFGQVKDKGWYNPAGYSTEGSSSRDLIATIQEARSRGIEVVILLLPERSDLRSRVPAEAMNCLNETLARGFGDDDSPPIVDLRDAIADDQFHDTLHLNQKGRMETSRRLAERLRQRSVKAEN